MTFVIQSFSEVIVILRYEEIFSSDLLFATQFELESIFDSADESSLLCGYQPKANSNFPRLKQSRN